MLQIVKMRNVSAPTDNQDSQHAPRMVRIELTDGHSRCTAVEFEHIHKLALDTTPPGTKLLFPHNHPVCGGFLVLNRSVIVLGGSVPSLVAQWTSQQSLANHKRAAVANGPPLFEPFSQVRWIICVCKASITIRS